MEYFFVSMLNGLSYGLLLFMLSSGLTLIFSMMGVINFAHGSFYMLGAYLAYSMSIYFGFWVALITAPLLVGLLGAGVEKFILRRIHRFGPVAELLVTFGLSFLILECVRLIWGSGPMNYQIPLVLDGAFITIFGMEFSLYRGFMMLVSLAMLVSITLWMRLTKIGLIIKAALIHPLAVQALGHDVPKIFMFVFAGGCALAALAGVVGGNTYVTEPNMAATLGGLVFVVVVVGGLGSLIGAFVASLLIGLIQTFAVTLDFSFLDFLNLTGMDQYIFINFSYWMKIKLSQLAPILPYLLMVIVLTFRPQGLLGSKDAV